MIEKLRKMRSQKGFTLLELLVVVAIIAILATLILANLNRARKQAQDAKVQSEVKSLSDAIQLYQTEHADNPSAIDVMSSGGGNMPVSGSSSQSGNAYLVPLTSGTDPLIKLPTHPASGKFYKYSGNVSASGSFTYTVCGDLIATTPGSYSITDGVPSKNAANCN